MASRVERWLQTGRRVLARGVKTGSAVLALVPWGQLEAAIGDGGTHLHAGVAILKHCTAAYLDSLQIGVF